MKTECSADDIFVGGKGKALTHIIIDDVIVITQLGRYYLLLL